MRAIILVQGSVAARYSPDDTAASPIVLMRDLVKFIGSTYKFSNIPQVPPGLMLAPVFTFQSGELIVEKGKIPISQITTMVGGTIVTAQSTDDAELVLNDFIMRADRELGYRLEGNIRRKEYNSGVVVEFSPGLERQISILERAQQVLNREIPRPDAPFKIKRLAFGFGDVGGPFDIQATINDLRRADFVIERRSGEPYESNRYFCTAPLPTTELVRVLEVFEREMQS